MNRLYTWLMLRFIRNSMSHEKRGNVAGVFRAIAEGMQNEWPEDNLSTLQGYAAMMSCEAMVKVASERDPSNAHKYAGLKGLYP